jgi:L-seryl-tRNA(Ser) seleniumtransferase
MTQPDSPSPQELLRRIPQVDRLLAAASFESLLAAHSRQAVLTVVRDALEELRVSAREGDLDESALTPEAIAAAVETRLACRAAAYYRRVINATGIVLHTGLGRAPLAPEAVAALVATAATAQRLELDLESGERGGRDEGCAALLRELTGCEAATVVNNNAAATLLVLAALARGRRVVLSRGEMVEIGGSYRVPEILRESGARLAEVGTTNRTHLADYRRALDESEGGDGHAGDGVGMLLKVHTSNYRVRGFTAEVAIEELVVLGRDHGVPVVHDLGSGSLVDLGALADVAGDEPQVRRSVAAGADVVCFSGDKLLGGPQAGILVGTAEAIARCRRHPLFRALRPGRLIYTALEATLRLYRDGGEAALARVPALARLALGREALEERARALAAVLQDGMPSGVEIAVVESQAQAGSGSMPDEALPSWAVRLTAQDRSAGELAQRLRTGEPAVVSRLHDDGLLLDLRTVAGDEIEPLAAAVRAALG